MPFWVFGITNPISLFFYFIIFEIGYKIYTAVQHGQWGSSFKWRLLIYVVLIVISTIFNYKILFTDDYRKSLVDVSPITSLNKEQVERLDEILETYKDYDFILKYEVREIEEHPDYYRVYDMLWYKSKPCFTLDIHIELYKDEKKAIESMQFWMNFLSKKKRYILMNNSNNTDVVLFDSWMDRAGHGVPVSNRFLRSHLRLGNAIIFLTEQPQQHQLDKNISNDFIKLLCELLTR